MTDPNGIFYLYSFLSSLILSLFLTPAARAGAIVLKIFDAPISEVKTHKSPVPYLGGVAIFLAFSLTLIWVRVITSFPTGTLQALRGILIGGGLVFVLGLIDDIKISGLHYKTKFIFQIAATILIMLFGVHIKFIEPTWMGLLISAFWIVGVTNAFNLVDIMDGLAGTIAFVAALFFLFISLPTEEVYVNFAAASLAGAVLGFLPYNLSSKMKIFMGDSGSLFLGFILAALSMGTDYQGETDLAVFAPLIILAIPLFDTLAVFILRILRGKSPFLGSKDHYALRMEIMGWSRKNILIFTFFSALLLGVSALAVTKVPKTNVILIYIAIVFLLTGFTKYILRAKIK